MKQATKLMNRGPRPAPPIASVTTLRVALDPCAPVLTIDKLNELRAVTRQSGVQNAFTIYPDVAQYIEDNCSGYNRQIVAAKVEKYAKRMAEHTWRLDGNVVQFNWDGNMHNGQHRNKGCIRSGQPYAVYLSFGHDPEDYKTMDQGAPRRGHDLFHQNNWYRPKEAAYTVTWLMRYRDGEFVSRMTPEPEHHFSRGVHFGQEKIERCLKVGMKVKALTGLPAQYIATAYYLAREKSAGEADKFFGAWAKGGDAVFPIQTKLVNAIRKLAKDSGKAVLDTIQVAMILKAWNQYAAGGAISAEKLKWRPAKTVNGEVVAGDEPPVVKCHHKHDPAS